jgi:hypothetical protein
MEEAAEFWVETVDESTGKPYYYHSVTLASVWQRPDGLIVPESELMEMDGDGAEEAGPSNGLSVNTADPSAALRAGGAAGGSATSSPFGSAVLQGSSAGGLGSLSPLPPSSAPPRPFRFSAGASPHTLKERVAMLSTHTASSPLISQRDSSPHMSPLNLSAARDRKLSSPVCVQVQPVLNDSFLPRGKLLCSLHRGTEKQAQGCAGEPAC